MTRLLAAALLALAATAAPAQDRREAGRVDLIEGDVLLEGKGVPDRAAKIDDAVYEGDTVTTLAGAELQLRMADGGYLSLRENTKITLTTYRANGDDQDSSLIDIAKGALRSVTGWIAKQRASAYSIRTPMVTIGVRGTDHEVVHFEPGDPRGEPGSYDKVNEGRTLMRSKSGTVEVGPNQSARFHPDLRSPRLLPSVPNFFRPARNEQRFVERSRISARTLEVQRADLRARRGLDRQEKKQVQKKVVEKKRFEKKAEKKPAEKKQFEKKQFEKKQFEKRQVDKKHLDKKHK